MKTLFLILTLLPLIALSQKVYYVSPSGNDGSAGTITAPFKTWQKLSSILKTGDTGYIRGGIYRPTVSGQDWICTWQNLSGVSIVNYPGEQPIFDFSGFFQTNNTTAIRVNSCTNIYLRGLRVINLLQNNNGNAIAGWEFHKCINVKIENCSVDNIGGVAFRHTDGSKNFTYINCDASRCGDPINTGGGNYGNADGFDSNSGIATYITCRAWWNSDDGFDCFNNDTLNTYIGCWSFWNGYKPGTFIDPGTQADGMGFKWGSTSTDQSSKVLRVYANCISFGNKSWGFDQNVARCKAQFYNNTSYQNKRGGWATGYGITPREASILKNNISFSDPVIVSDPLGLVTDHNTWNGITATASSFVSTDTTGVTRARSAEGSLPKLNFLKLSPSSNLIDKGVDVGYGNDLGAFQFIPTQSIYYSIQRSQTFTKNDCSIGMIGSDILYIVPYAKYTSMISQADADARSFKDVQDSGQIYANKFGTCSTPVIYYNEIQSATFTRNNCGSGFTGSAVTYTVQDSIYSSTISQSDANLKAAQDISSNGQNYANVYGTCTANPQPPPKCSWWDKFFKRNGCRFSATVLQDPSGLVIDSPEEGSFVLTDEIGRTLKTGLIVPGTNKIPITRIPAISFLTITNKTETEVYKIIPINGN